MTVPVPNQSPNPRPRSLTRIWTRNLTLILFGLGLGLGLSRLIDRSLKGTTDLLSGQTQTAQSLKTLHDKLDQIDELNQSIQLLTDQVTSLDQTISLQNDLSSLREPDPHSSTLGTSSADLYPAVSSSNSAIGGLDAVGF